MRKVEQDYGSRERRRMFKAIGARGKISFSVHDAMFGMLQAIRDIRCATTDEARSAASEEAVEHAKTILGTEDTSHIVNVLSFLEHADHRVKQAVNGVLFQAHQEMLGPVKEVFRSPK